MFFASEVAAITGRHPYRKQYEAFERAWERHDASSLRAALLGSAPSERVAAEVAAAPAEVRALLDLPPPQTPAEVRARVQNSSVCMPRSLHAHARDVAFGGFGIAREADALALFDQPTTRPDRFFSRADAAFALGGRVDAVLAADASVCVEVKNRVNRMPALPPAYDCIQVRAYAWILGGAHGILFERFGSETRATTILNDDESFDQILDDLRGVAHFMRKCIDDPCVARAYAASSRRSAHVRKNVSNEK